MVPLFVFAHNNTIMVNTDNAILRRSQQTIWHCKSHERICRSRRRGRDSKQTQTVTKNHSRLVSTGDGWVGPRWTLRFCRIDAVAAANVSGGCIESSHRLETGRPRRITDGQRAGKEDRRPDRQTDRQEVRAGRL